MKHIIYDAQTGEVTETGVEDIELVADNQPPTDKERIEALEMALLEVILNG